MAVRLAFTGTGFAKVHARAAKTLDDVEMVAVVNHRAESMAAFVQEFGISRQYADVQSLLRDGNVDALIVTTPNYLHAPQTIAVLEAGVHVLVEKPMAMNASEAEAMLDASQRSGAKLMVAHCFRFDPQVKWLRERLQNNGALGEAIRTKCYGVHVGWGPGGWFTQRALAGGGAMADVGIHAIDTTRYLLGDPLPESVYARIGTHYGDYDVDDTGVIIVNWQNGVTSYIESGWWQPHADGRFAAAQVYYQHGWAQLFPTQINQKDSVEAFPGEEPDGQGKYDAQLAYFVDCIREDRLPMPGGAEGLINMQIVDAAYESAQTGNAVLLGG